MSDPQQVHAEALAAGPRATPRGGGMIPMDDLPVASSALGMDDIARADMRIEVVKREINELLRSFGFTATITNYAAMVVIHCLDTFDESVVADSYRDGFEAGMRNSHALWEQHGDGWVNVYWGDPAAAGQETPDAG